MSHPPEYRPFIDDLRRIFRGSGVGVATHPVLNTVVVRVKASATHFILRAKTDRYELTVPRGADIDSTIDALQRLVPNLTARKHTPSLRYTDGQTLRLDGISICILHRHILGKGGAQMSMDISGEEPSITVCTLSVSDRLDFEDAATTKFISSCLKSIASKAAPQLLLPMAREVSRRLGVAPKDWQISRGLRVLGKCDTRGIISLSSNLVFLPRQLREYVVCHELAHLTEMNHSRRFHAICNQYCGGREAELAARLKAFVWPICR